MTPQASPTQAGTGFRSRADRAQRFLKKDLWRQDLSVLPRLTAAAYQSLQIGYIVVNGFFKDKLPILASALTYTTLLSIVPLLAFAFAIAKGLKAHEELKKLIDKIPPEWPQQLREMAVALFNQVDQTDFRAMGTFGLALLAFLVIRTLSTIEGAFNHVWGVKVGRTWTRRVSDYISMVVIAPILLLTATTANAVINSEAALNALRGWTGPTLFGYYRVLLGLLPYTLIWIAFTTLYLVMPNTRVRISSALAGGIAAGTLWGILQWAYIHFQITIANYNAIYGTFASIPIFMMWLYLSWLIILAGAEISFAHQNRRTFHAEEESTAASFAVKEALGLEIATSAARQFLNGGGPWRPAGFSTRREIPTRLVNEVIFELTQSKVLVPVAGPEPAYVPARDPGRIPVGEVLDALKGFGSEPGGDFPSPSVCKALDTVHAAARKQMEKLTLEDLAAPSAR